MICRDTAVWEGGGVEQRCEPVPRPGRLRRAGAGFLHPQSGSEGGDSQECTTGGRVLEALARKLVDFPEKPNKHRVNLAPGPGAEEGEEIAGVDGAVAGEVGLGPLG